MKEDLEKQAAKVILFFWRTKKMFDQKNKKFLQIKSKFETQLIRFKKMTLKLRKRKYLRKYTYSKKDL